MDINGIKNINNQISDHYCSFEVSKLLFEKGFTQNQTWCYYRGTSIIIDKMPASGSKGRDLGKDYIPCFTLDLAIEWIRVNFGIWIVSNKKDSWLDDNNWYWVIRTQLNSYPFEKFESSLNKQLFNCPQEAKETALNYTLKNLI